MGLMRGRLTFAAKKAPGGPLLARIVLISIHASRLYPLRDATRSQGRPSRNPSQSAVPLLEAREDHGRGGEAAPRADRRYFSAAVFYTCKRHELPSDVAADRSED